MRIQRVVVGMDFSPAAIAAARWVSERFAPAAELVLAHAVDGLQVPAFAREAGIDMNDLATSAREFAQLRLARTRAHGTGPRPRTVIRDGPAHEVVVAVAVEERADLVVVGPYGRHVRGWQPLGSTTIRIVRTSPVPVLVGIEPRPTPPRHVLVPVDDCDATPRLLSWVHDLAETFDAEVTLLHVLSNAVYSHVASMAYATAGEGAAAREIRDELRDIGIAWLDRLAATGIDRDRVTSMVTFGDAGNAIVSVAESIGAELIAIGRRGSGVVVPALLGSTVRTVLHGAHCPVLVVPEPEG